MKKLLFLLGLSLTLVSCDEILGSVDDGGLTEGEIIQGLKVALEHGTDTATSNLSVTDGFLKDEIVKILLPKEALPVYDRISTIPLLDDYVEKTIVTINRAAEDAATEAKPIFVDAILEMTVEDGMSILHGSDTAATYFLRKKTIQKLFDAFQPKIQTSLEKEIVFGISADQSYKTLINTYNTASLNGFLFDEIKTNSLSEHTTNKALRGLFIKVGDEEKLIREDPLHRVTDILEKVFAELD